MLPLGSQGFWAQYAMRWVDRLTEPPEGVISPSIARSRVDFPLPVGPETIVNPWDISMSMSFKMAYFLPSVRCWIWMAGIIVSVAVPLPIVRDNLVRCSDNEGRSRKVWIRSNPAKDATARGTIVITIFAGCVIIPRRAIVVNAVSVSRLCPR